MDTIKAAQQKIKSLEREREWMFMIIQRINNDIAHQNNLILDAQRSQHMTNNHHVTLLINASHNVNGRKRKLSQMIDEADPDEDLITVSYANETANELRKRLEREDNENKRTRILDLNVPYDSQEF